MLSIPNTTTNHAIIYKPYKKELLAYYAYVHNLLVYYTHVGDATLERISPRVIVLDPPEKLVIETRASGGYRQFDWNKNGIPFTLAQGQPFTVTLQEFSNFFEIFVREPTTADDLAVYEAELTVNTGPQPPEVQFTVTPYSEYMCETLFEPIKVLFNQVFFSHTYILSSHIRSKYINKLQSLLSYAHIMNYNFLHEYSV